MAKDTTARNEALSKLQEQVEHYELKARYAEARARRVEADLRLAIAQDELLKRKS